MSKMYSKAFSVRWSRKMLMRCLAVLVMEGIKEVWDFTCFRKSIVWPLNDMNIACMVWNGKTNSDAKTSGSPATGILDKGEG